MARDALHHHDTVTVMNFTVLSMHAWCLYRRTCTAFMRCLRLHRESQHFVQHTCDACSVETPSLMRHFLLFCSLVTLKRNKQKSRAALKTLDKDGKASNTPTSVQEIVAARIDTLESTVSLVLKVGLPPDLCKPHHVNNS